MRCEKGKPVLQGGDAKPMGLLCMGGSRVAEQGGGAPKSSALMERGERMRPRAKKPSPRTPGSAPPHAMPSHEKSAPEAVRIRLLGGFWVSVGSRTIEEDARRLRKAASLVKLLALSPSHRLHREQVMEALWPDSGEAASNNLRQAVHAARRTLQPDPELASGYLSLRGRAAHVMSQGRLWVDVEAFEEAAATLVVPRNRRLTGRRSSCTPGNCCRRIATRSGRRSGDRSCGRASSRCSSSLRRLYEERGGIRAPAIEALRRVVAEEPTHEEAHAGLMRLYALSGRQEKRWRQYERLRKRSPGELGTEPGASSARSQRGDSGRQVSGRAASAHRPASKRGRRWSRQAQPARPEEQLRRPRARDRRGQARAGHDAAADPHRGGGLGQDAPRPGGGPGPRRSLPGRGVAGGAGAALRAGAGAPGGGRGPGGARAARTSRSPTRSSTPCAPREMLLVLDNCEHLVEAAARLVDCCSTLARACRILATSREALSVAGEVSWPVPASPCPTRGARPRSRSWRATSRCVCSWSGPGTAIPLSP